jgi:PAS domain S-box-containing protein
MLQKARYEVTEAATGRDALRLAAEKPDLVILDVGLPDLSGYEVCRKIKADPVTSSIPVLHLSASFAETENRVRGLEGGADGYLTYPVEPPELLANVQALLRVREAERKAREQLALLRVTLSSIGDGVIATDPQGRVTFINPVAQALTGWSEEEATGKPVDDVFRIVSDTTGKPAENPVGRVIREGVTVALADHTVLIARDGTRRPIDDTAAPIRDAEQVFLGVVLIFRDVSQRRLAEKAVRESEERFRAVFDNTLAVIYLLDTESRFLLVNRRFQTLFHVSNEQIAGKPLEEVFPKACADAYRENNRKVLAARTAMEFEEFAPDGGEPRVYVSVKVPLLDALGTPYAICGVSTDITEHKRLAEILRQRAEELGEEGRRKDEFLAMLAHELRNPLAPIRNAVQIIRLAGSQSPAVEQAGEMVERQVQYMTRLVDDLLDVSRVSRGKVQLRKEQVSLATIIVRAIENARPLIDARQHELILALPPRPVRLEGDPTRLVQILGNLLTNAAKYTDTGGQIWLTAEREDDWAVLLVRDSGIGIRPDLLPRIFDLFVQAERGPDRAEGGLGIGLTLVRSLVEMHGGTVTVTSEGPGRGSEFVVRLPALPEVAPTPGRAAPGPVRHIPPTPQRRVMIVDDNVDSAVSLAMLLQLQRHEVNVVHDGREALVAVRRHRPEIVFIDIGLPGMDGHEVARRLRQEHGRENLLLIAMTGYGQDEYRRRSQDAGFDAHMVKPVDLNEVQSFLARGGSVRRRADEAEGDAGMGQDA